MKNYISPLYIMELINKINDEIWRKFPSSKYRQVEMYLKRWQEEINQWERDFLIIYKDEDREVIDLLRTLSLIDSEKIIQIAIDLGIETPGFIPIISHLSTSLEVKYSTAHQVFKNALEKVQKEPNMAIVMANSALESIVKHILEDERLGEKDFQNETLYDLVQRILKKFTLYPNKELSDEIKIIGSGLLKVSKAIEGLRSEKTFSHGKGSQDIIFDDSIVAYFIVNSVATVGLFLIQFYEKNFSNNKNDDEKFSDINIEDIPF